MTRRSDVIPETAGSPERAAAGIMDGMNAPPVRQKPFAKVILVLLALGVLGLAIVFVWLATIGDDVPSELPPASQGSTGD
jgi:hypothetical protein